MNELTMNNAVAWFKEQAAKHTSSQIDIVEVVEAKHYGVDAVDINYVLLGFEDDVSIWLNQGEFAFGNGTPWL